jgi:aspartyl-tRNA(Asn)/glutamyl-tRNA(Gln) amidotransferase subunit A
MMETTVRALAGAGAWVDDVALPASFGEVLARHRVIMAVEAAQFHGARLRRHPEDYDPFVRALVEEGLACPAPEYARAREHQQRLRDEVLASLEEVDALVVPGAVGPAPDVSTTGDPAFNSPWSYTGLPLVSIPTGWTADGLPLSVQVIGRSWAEAEVLSVAAWCERVVEFEHREVPLLR